MNKQHLPERLWFWVWALGTPLVVFASIFMGYLFFIAAIVLVILLQTGALALHRDSRWSLLWLLSLPMAALGIALLPWLRYLPLSIASLAGFGFTVAYFLGQEYLLTRIFRRRFGAMYLLGSVAGVAVTILVSYLLARLGRGQGFGGFALTWFVPTVFYGCLSALGLSWANQSLKSQ